MYVYMYAYIIDITSYSVKMLQLKNLKDSRQDLHVQEANSKN